MNARHASIARLEDSHLIVVDCQERLFPVIHESEQLEARLQVLIKGASHLKVATLISEQYRAGLGPTIASAVDAAKDHSLIEKQTFSCFGNEDFCSRLEEVGRGVLVICGIESHICVLQTALDALAQGYQVHVPADAIGSRDRRNRRNAIRRLNHAGAVITNTESVLFEWMESCEHESFKAVQGLLK